MKIRKRCLWLLMVLVIPVGYVGVAIPGNFKPASAPGSTMRTQEEIQPSWDKKITDASKRFATVLDGAAVLDRKTGLVWEASPDTALRTWVDAIKYASDKEVGGRKGWRLPTVEELESLVDASVSGSPKLPGGHPFTNVRPGGYWASTPSADNATFAWFVNFYDGLVYYVVKDNDGYVWCVREGRGYDFH